MTKTVGFIGLGNMGSGMARSLARAGFNVIAFDANPEQLKELRNVENLTLAASLTETARSDALVLMLPSSNIVQEVLVGQGALLERLPEGGFILDMSSSDPEVYAELAPALRAKNCQIIDAPVSGSPDKAANGMLTLMVGGETAEIDRALPFLEAMGDSIFRTGPLGSGQVMKAVNNLMTAGGLIMAIEAIRLAGRAGLDEHQVNQILNVSTGRNDATVRKIEPYVLSKTFDSGFALSLLAKDLRIIESIAKKNNFDLLLGKQVINITGLADQAFDGNVDHTEIARWLEQKNPPQTKQSQTSNLDGRNTG